MIEIQHNFINGEWSRADQTSENRNPANPEDLVGVYARGGKADVDAAVARVGDVVSLGGGEVFQLFQSPTARESVVEQPPAECLGPYWVVGEIE